MSIGRVWSNITTRGTTYQQGNISTEKEANAVKAVRNLEAQANAVAADMLTHDNTDIDFNPKLKNNVYLDGSGGSNYAGHCVKSNSDKITRLDATGKGEHFTISTEDGHREIRHTKEVVTEKGSSFQEEWAIFDGSQVKYKAINY